MQLADWIEENGFTVQWVADRLGTSRTMVSRWAHGHIIPKRAYLEGIYQLTQGAVTPNDFYGLRPRRLRASAKPRAVAAAAPSASPPPPVQGEPMQYTSDELRLLYSRYLAVVQRPPTALSREIQEGYPRLIRRLLLGNVLLADTGLALSRWIDAHWPRDLAWPQQVPRNKGAYFIPAAAAGLGDVETLRLPPQRRRRRRAA